MTDVQTKLTDLREEAYTKVLKCLPYPRQWVRYRIVIAHDLSASNIVMQQT